MNRVYDLLQEAMRSVILLLVIISGTAGVLWDCSSGSECAAEKLTFKIPGSSEAFCCPGYYQGYTVETSVKNGVVNAHCQCYISNVG